MILLCRIANAQFLHRAGMTRNLSWTGLEILIFHESTLLISLWAPNHLYRPRRKTIKYSSKKTSSKLCSATETSWRHLITSNKSWRNCVARGKHLLRSTRHVTPDWLDLQRRLESIVKKKLILLALENLFSCTSLHARPGLVPFGFLAWRCRVFAADPSKSLISHPNATHFYCFPVHNKVDGWTERERSIIDLLIWICSLFTK